VPSVYLTVLAKRECFLLIAATPRCGIMIQMKT
jgi:hypothetical protein